MHNRGAIKFLVAWLLLVFPYLLLAWPTLQGHGTIGMVLGLAVVSFFFGFIFSIGSFVRVIAAVIYWKRELQFPWGLPVDCVVFLGSLLMLGFSIWIWCHW